MTTAKRVPIYRQVAETIKGRILSEEYRVGDYIAPAKELEKQFSVSNITVRKALEILVKDGYLMAHQGRGTQVTRRPEELVELEVAGSFWEWVDSVASHRIYQKTEVRAIEVIPMPGSIRQLLGPTHCQSVWRMKRIREIKGRPAAFIVNYTLPMLMEHTHKAHFENKTFLSVFQDICHVILSRAEQRVRPVAADIDLSNILNIDFGDPLFLVENTYFDRKDKPVAVTYLYCRGDLYVYKTTLKF